MAPTALVGALSVSLTHVARLNKSVRLKMLVAVLSLWMLLCKVILRAEIVSLKQPIELRHVVFVGYLSVVLCAESASIEY